MQNSVNTQISVHIMSLSSFPLVHPVSSIFNVNKNHCIGLSRTLSFLVEEGWRNELSSTQPPPSLGMQNNSPPPPQKIRKLQLPSPYPQAACSANQTPPPGTNEEIQDKVRIQIQCFCQWYPAETATSRQDYYNRNIIALCPNSLSQHSYGMKI